MKTAANYVLLAKSGITVVPTCDITGDIGISPIASGAMTDFSFTDTTPLVYLTSTQVTGRAFAADYVAPTPAQLTSGVSDMEAAYLDAADVARMSPDPASRNVNGGVLGGAHGGALNQFTPGVYTFDEPVSIAADIYFRGSGECQGEGDLDVFIFQIHGTLALTAKKRVHLQNGALAKNIIWQVSGAVGLAAESHMEGIILGKTSVDMITDSSINGRIFAQTAVTLGKATVTEPADVAFPCCV
jgi:hypothetical protein